MVDLFPAEIIREICEYLSIRDVTNFRLASSVCASAGIDCLVREIRVIFTRESFEKLLNISKHPEMSKHVITIYYEPVSWKAMSQDEYGAILESVPSLEHENILPSSEDPIQMACDLEAYNKICKDQDLMKKSEFSKLIFSQVLPKLGSLRRFIIPTYECEPHPFGQTKRLFKGFGAIKGRRSYDNVHGVDRGEIFTFLAAAAKAGTRLEHLHIREINLNMLPHAPISTDRIFPNGPEARYLHYLYIDRFNSVGEKSTYELRRLLQATSNLRTLMIGYSNSEGRTDWDKFIVGLTLPHLKRLEFFDIVGSSTTLTKFLQRHVKTLRRLRIHYCVLKSDVTDWAEIFDSIKNDLTLEKVHFDGLDGNKPFHIAWGGWGVGLHHYYFGSKFHILLADRLLHKNLLAKECPLTPSELWRDYLVFWYAETLKAEARDAELNWDPNNEEDVRLRGFLNR